MIIAVNLQTVVRQLLEVVLNEIKKLYQLDLDLQLLKEKVGCMAGIEIISSLNLTTSRRTKEANSNGNCSRATSCLGHKHLNAFKANNYKTLQYQQRPLTLCLVVMMALTLTLMPQYAKAAALRKDLDVSASSLSQTSVERELLLLASAEELIEEAINDAMHSKTLSSSSASSSASSSSSSEYADSLDVLKHMERMEEHQKERRANLRKRHLNHLNNLRTFDGSSHQIEWHNPCNVARENQNVNLAKMPRRGYYYLKKFKDDIRKEYITRSLVLKHIKIDDMESWRLHRDYYTFLPKLKQNSKISLSRWYRNMQMFVASFAYLGRTQYNWDMKKQRYVSETTKELDQLLSSARLILCELETTINGSHPTKNVNMLKSLTRDEMADKLQFKTKEQERNGATLIEPNLLDLKFTKDAYFKYLAVMRKILKHKLSSKNRDVKIDSSENSSSESTKNTVDDSTGSINISSIMRSDSDMSLGESFEMIMKTSNQQRPQAQRKTKRTHKNNASKKSAELPKL